MKALILIRTPFQAWLIEKVLEKESISNYDLIYFTQNDSSEDKYYYKKLTLKARKSKYIFVNKQKFNILSLFLLRVKSIEWCKKTKYENIFCASIDALYIRSIIKSNIESQLITFDDGSANINTSGLYFNNFESMRDKTYKTFMNALSLKEVKNLIQKHYTMYKGYENIVGSEKLIFLNKMNENFYSKNNSTRVYFLGAPFRDAMNEQAIDKLEKYVKNIKVDAYVPHPREKYLLKIDADVLEKKGRIAEEAIVSDAKGASIVLIGGFSSVMLNIGHICKDILVILPKDSPKSSDISALSKDFGFRVQLI